MKKIFGFDLLRFILAVAIVLFHINVSGLRALPQGYLAVEMFFMLSGFLLAKSYMKYKEIIADKLDLFKQIISNKFYRLYPEYIFITVIVLFIYFFIFNDNRFPDLFYNMILFGESGTARNIVDGTWFVSALFWTSFFILFLMIWCKKIFFYILAPLLFLVSVVTLFQIDQSSLMLFGQTFLPFVSAGIWRALAAMSAGIILYHFYIKNEQLFQNKNVLLILGTCGILSTIEIFYLFAERPVTLLPYNIYFFGFLLILSLVVFNRQLSRWVNNKICSFLSDISYMIFLTNILIQRLVFKYFPYNQNLNFDLYYLIVFLSCLIGAIILYGIYKMICYGIKNLNNTKIAQIITCFFCLFIVLGVLQTHHNNKIIDICTDFIEKVSSPVYLTNDDVVVKHFEISNTKKLKFIKCRFFTWDNKYNDNNKIIFSIFADNETTPLKSETLSMNQIKNNDISKVDFPTILNCGKYKFVISVNKSDDKDFAISVITKKHDGNYLVNNVQSGNNDIQCIIQ